MKSPNFKNHSQCVVNVHHFSVCGEWESEVIFFQLNKLFNFHCQANSTISSLVKNKEISAFSAAIEMAFHDLFIERYAV